MGDFSGNPGKESAALNRERISMWNNPPTNGRADDLVDRFSELGIRGNPQRDDRFQVMEAVVAAENTIRMQVRVFVFVFFFFFQLLRIFISVMWIVEN